MRMTDLEAPTAPPAGPPARWLLGRLSEHRELGGRLAERPGLLIIEADPLSGTSGVLAHAVQELGRPAVYVDARGAADALDLAMLIADATIALLRPSAAPWWLGNDVAGDVEGLELARTLATRGVAFDQLRLGGGRAAERLREALSLVAALGGADALLVIDHLDAILESMSRTTAEELLAVLRADRQSPGSAEMLLVGRPQGRLLRALADPQAALWRAGQSLRFRRAAPERIVEDLAIARHWTDLPLPTIREAAELADGAPAVIWRILDTARDRLLPNERASPAHAAWDLLRQQSEPLSAQQFELLGCAHRVAPTVLTALSHGLGPYELPLNGKTVRDALAALRARGIIWSPEKARWRIADPLLTAWACHHSAPWIRRRTRHLA